MLVEEAQRIFMSQVKVRLGGILNPWPLWRCNSAAALFFSLPMAGRVVPNTRFTVRMKPAVPQ